MEFLELIPNHLTILIPSIYVLGVFLKAIESVKDKYITVILFCFAIVYSVILGRAMDIDVANAILHGILAWGTAIGIHQTTKQLRGDV